jgi:hypothetical protein
MKRLFASSMLIVAVGLTAAVALAEDRPAPRPPPEEAFTACDGKTAGAECTVTFGDRSLTGTCLAPPPDVNETRLFCAPPRPAHDGSPHAPPR